MPGAAIGMGLSAAGSIASGVLSGQGFGNAQSDVKDYYNKAIDAYKNYGSQGLDALGQFWNTEQGNLNPYMEAGREGLGGLTNMLGPGGALSQGYGQQFHAPTAEEAAQTPGYQFALQQGQQALERSAAGRGNLLTGGTAKAMDQYSQGMASQNYQNAYNNALQGFNTNYNVWNNDNNNLFGRYAALSGVGQNAANSLNSGANSMASMYNGNLIGTGTQIGGAYQNLGQLMGQLDIGKMNAYAGMAGNLGSLGMMSGMGGFGGGNPGAGYAYTGAGYAPMG